MDYRRARFKLLRKYIVYKVIAKHRKGFGIHSPFTFSLLNKTFREKVPVELKRQGRRYRSEFLGSNLLIPRSTMGAGSLLSRGRPKEIPLRRLIRQTAIPPKYGNLLFLLAKHFGSDNILELGTGLGMSTFYLASGAINSMVISIEGHAPFAKMAEQELANANFANIEVVNASFEEELDKLKREGKRFGLFFIDGDHTLRATMENFSRCYDISTQNAIFIFDDIHWSNEMEEAWESIKQQDRCRISMDLFRLGIVFTSKKFLKQDYIVRY